MEKFPFFVETEDSLPCSEEPTTGPYPQPVHIVTPHLKIKFNITLISWVLYVLLISSAWFDGAKNSFKIEVFWVVISCDLGDDYNGLGIPTASKWTLT